MALRRSHGVPKEATAFRRRVSVSCFYLRHLKNAAPRGFPYDYGTRRLCGGRESRTAAAARNVSRARYARRPSSVRPLSPVAAQAMLAAPHFQKAYQPPKAYPPLETFSPAGHVRCPRHNPRFAAVDGKSRRLSCAVHSPRPDAAGLKPAGAAHRSLFRPSVQPKIHINGAVPAERLAQQAFLQAFPIFLCAILPKPSMQPPLTIRPAY